ncbi:MAG: FCD domain-containing protein [Nitriliruptorales bacterium]|nr:FCD domain-containing protein [Nitriliruptorales bacterium]
MSRRQTAHQRAYDYLKEQLANGGATEGVFLTEGVVAEQLGISRTPVREALLRLDAEKLVTLVPGRGAFVPQVTERGMREVMEVRELIETHAVTRLGTLTPRSLLDQLDAHIEDQRDLLGQDAAAFIDQDRAFHQSIVDASGSELLSELYASMRDRQTRMGIRAVLADEARFERVIDEHRAIIDALRAEDVAQAVAASRIHLRKHPPDPAGEEGCPVSDLRITCLQLEPRPAGSDAATYLEDVCEQIRAAGDADLIVLPELWHVGYFAFDRYEAEAAALDGPLTERLSALARELRITLHVGSVVESGAMLSNTSIVYGPDGDALATYRKIHVFGYGSREPELVEGGRHTSIFPVADAAAGMAICYDLRFPELFRATVDDVAIYVVPATASNCATATCSSSARSPSSAAPCARPRRSAPA